MVAPELLAEAKRLILRANHVTVVCHITPDGDTVGAELALGFALQQLGKPYALLSPDPVPSALAFLPGVEAIRWSPDSMPATDLLVSLEVSNLERLGRIYSDNVALFQRLPLLNIDHHQINCLNGTVNLIDPSAAAVSEQVYELLEALGVEIDTDIATCLLTGLVSDSLCFRTPSTSSHTLMVAADLVARGGELATIAELALRTRSVAALRLWGRVLSRVRFAEGIVWAVVTEEMLQKCQVGPDGADGLVDFLAGAREASVAVLLRETPSGAIRVSLRSSGKVNVAEIATHFNGGGHPRAAGFTLLGPVSQVKRRVLGFLRKATSENR